MTQKSAARPAPTAPSGRRGTWRTAVVAVCLILLGLVAPLSIVSLWTHDEIADSDRYVAMVAPLARNPEIQDAVATRLTQEITSRLASSGVSINDTVSSWISSQVRKSVATAAFGTAWDEANRAAHRQLIGLLNGTSRVAAVRGDAVTIDLAAFIDLVRARLVASGLPLAANIPTVHVEFTVFEARHLSVLQKVYRTLDDLAYVLPFVGLALLVVALAVGRSRRRTLLAAALVLALSMLLLWLALVVARYVYLDAVSARQISRATAEALYDAITGFIRTSLLVVLASSVVVAAIAWLAGPVSSAVRRRSGAGPTA